MFLLYQWSDILSRSLCLFFFRNHYSHRDSQRCLFFYLFIYLFIYYKNRTQRT